MAQMTWRASEELLARVRHRAAQQGKSLNEWVTEVLDAVSNPGTAGSERQQIRERLAAAGLLHVPLPSPAKKPPTPQRIAAARKAAGRGTSLSELVTDERG